MINPDEGGFYAKTNSFAGGEFFNSPGRSDILRRTFCQGIYFSSSGQAMTWLDFLRGLGMMLLSLWPALIPLAILAIIEEVKHKSRG